MRPAGMSSDEEEDDDYFPVNLIPMKRHSDNRPNAMDNLLDNRSDALRNLLENSSKTSLFHRAAEEGDLNKMQELIEVGVSVDDSKIREWTPLMKACSEGKYEAVNFLLEKGANPNQHKELFTPLMACCTPNYILEGDRLECIRHLIRFGADVNATDKHKCTVLMMAAERGFNNIVDELLNTPGIDINLIDKEGWNALFHAVYWNNKSVVEKLINAGIDGNQMSSHDEIGVIQMAEMKNHREIVKILKMWKCGDVEDDNEVYTPWKNVSDTVRNALIDFRNQFPDENGIGGFSRDLRDFFAGVGIEKMYDKLKIEMSLPDFLVLKNLEDIGIRFEPVRRKIKTGIHRYHLAPWHSNSLYPVRHIIHLDMEDYIKAISNVAKHMAIMYATLDYVRSQASLRTGKISIFCDREILDSLIGSYLEAQKTIRIIGNILKRIDHIKPVGDAEADYVGPKRNSRSIWKGLWLRSGIVCSFFGFLYCKYRFFQNWG